MTDAHGNEYDHRIGNSRSFTREQLRKLLLREHEERGCCCEHIGCHTTEEKFNASR